MNKNIQVIKVAGRAKRANVDGETVYREEQIFVPSERGWFRILDTYDHFCYYNRRKFGATLVCSCGSTAGIYNFEAYAQFQSTNMGRIICCTSLVENRKHTDGSTS
jgi:hypothetical protein